eukprot:15457645-Alexandrium_andersonii.AAC.1
MLNCAPAGEGAGVRMLDCAPAAATGVRDLNCAPPPLDGRVWPKHAGAKAQRPTRPKPPPRPRRRSEL